jgi:predicted O-methyltransferase YrrM
MSDVDRVDIYIHNLFIPDDPALTEAVADATQAGLPMIQVPESLGKLLGLLVRAAGARRVLEIGTLGGYSAIWMARALPPGGSLLSLEVSERHAEVARANLARVGVADRVEVRVGRALDLLPTLADGEPFDLVFIDADKTSYPDYLDWALRLTHPGSMIVADNVVRGGEVTDPDNAAPDIRALDRFNRLAAADPRLDAIIVPNRGGNDGILMAVVRHS